MVVLKPRLSQYGPEFGRESGARGKTRPAYMSGSHLSSSERQMTRLSGNIVCVLVRQRLYFVLEYLVVGAKREPRPSKGNQVVLLLFIACMHLCREQFGGGSLWGKGEPHWSHDLRMKRLSKMLGSQNSSSLFGCPGEGGGGRAPYRYVFGPEFQTQHRWIMLPYLEASTQLV